MNKLTWVIAGYEWKSTPMGKWLTHESGIIIMTNITQQTNGGDYITFTDGLGNYKSQLHNGDEINITIIRNMPYVLMAWIHWLIQHTPRNDYISLRRICYAFGGEWAKYACKVFVNLNANFVILYIQQVNTLTLPIYRQTTCINYLAIAPKESLSIILLKNINLLK